jgi:hypothetical protein
MKSAIKNSLRKQTSLNKKPIAFVTAKKYKKTNESK